jgi:hypothetical protein
MLCGIGLLIARDLARDVIEIPFKSSSDLIMVWYGVSVSHHLMSERFSTDVGGSFLSSPLLKIKAS